MHDIPLHSRRVAFLVAYNCKVVCFVMGAPVHNHISRMDFLLVGYVLKLGLFRTPTCLAAHMHGLYVNFAGKIRVRKQFVSDLPFVSSS
jgi:hypothetical protein